MSETMSEKDWQRKYAVDCFNGTWDLLDKANRTPEEEARMIHMAHASRYHWGEIGDPLNFARGDWQIARVYAVLGFGEMALKYAQSCLRLCQENGIGDFDLAFAYEAMARAYAVLGDAARKNEFLQLAQQAGKVIAEDDDRQYFLGEMGTIG